MVRPKRCRRIASLPDCTIFKPAGIPARTLDEIVLQIDELEALRLVDCEGLYQQQAASQMEVSRQTFGRIVEGACKKVAKALVDGCVLRIEGGRIEVAEERVFECSACDHVWEELLGTGRPEGCPACKGDDFFRVAEEGPTRQVQRRTNASDIAAEAVGTTAGGAALAISAITPRPVSQKQ